jgi:hypothetical protein
MGSLGKIEPSRRLILWTESDTLAEALAAGTGSRSDLTAKRSDLTANRDLKPTTGTAIAATTETLTATASVPSKTILLVFIITPPGFGDLARCRR